MSYYDVLMEDQYHMYFSLSANAPSSYKTWNAMKVQAELLPLLDATACRSTRKARPGDTMDWTEFRRAGGALVIHIQHLGDLKYQVEVSSPRKFGLCS